MSSLRSQLLRMANPAFHAARQPDLLADLVRGLGSKARDLPVVEDAEIVELLLDRGRDMPELLEVVGNSAWPGEHLVAGVIGGGRQLLHDRLSGRTDVDAHVALRARNAIDGGTRDQVAVERDGATGIVITGNDERDAIRVAVGVDDGCNRNIEPPRFLDRDVLLV